ncbi:MAG: pantoate--beta-alanine ligase [Candidatus Cloacimonetes bacterium]|nr:pantoate--beta-alanine ligase [Candidatus Cloacimonadota bacterium]MDD4667280.1 pantoate--beta-alanine ligase [Candidatus Cloacimonadota bacterium]
MLQINSLQEMQEITYPTGSKIGFVPTMGYLHEGHLSLVDASRKECKITVVSIFINPAQFGPNEDLASYPRDLERDLNLLRERGVDYVFFPSSGQMYPDGYHSWVEVEALSNILCGASRPGHFRGVCTVVLKLINLVRPHRMYMGEKDYQQLTILRTMAVDLNLPLRIVGCPIVREPDGLAKSSRNVYLDQSQRQIARSLSEALQMAQSQARSGILDSAELIRQATEHLQSRGARVDYVSIVDSRTLMPHAQIDEYSRMLLAAYVGKTRLIDNLQLL